MTKQQAIAAGKFSPSEPKQKRWTSSKNVFIGQKKGFEYEAAVNNYFDIMERMRVAKSKHDSVYVEFLQNKLKDIVIENKRIDKDLDTLRINKHFYDRSKDVVGVGEKRKDIPEPSVIMNVNYKREQS